MDTQTTWQRFAAGDVAARDALLKEHLSLVYFVARQLSKTLSADTELDELVNAGVFGLMAALQAFDPSRGHSFSTFAVMRIRGAILDELRRQDPVPRSIRRKARDLARGREGMMRILGREPTAAELAEHLGVDAETVWRWEADIESSVQLSFDQGTGDQDDPVPTPIRVLATDANESPDAKVAKEQEVALLRAAIMKLGQQERTVLTLYYFEELKLHQIAKVLGVTESRVSQICAKAIKRLREQLAPMRALA